VLAAGKSTTFTLSVAGAYGDASGLSVTVL